MVCTIISVKTALGLRSLESNSLKAKKTKSVCFKFCMEKMKRNSCRLAIHMYVNETQSVEINSEEMSFCFQNCSDLLSEKIVVVIEKNFWNSRPSNFPIFFKKKIGKIQSIFHNEKLLCKSEFWDVRGGCS